MPRKFLPAKILVNRAVELKQLQHPREKLLRRLNVALGSVTLIGLVALTILFPRILVFTYAAFFVLGLMFWLRAGFKRARFYGRSSLVTDATFPEIYYIKEVVTRVLGYAKLFSIRLTVDDRLEPRWKRWTGHRTLILNEKLVTAMIDRQQIGEMIWLIGRMIGLQATRQSAWPLARWLLFFSRINPLTWPVYNIYRRLTHFTADRVGLAVNLSLIDAAEAMKKLLVGVRLHTRLDFNQFETLAHEQRRKPFILLDEIILAKPALAKRFVDLVDFCCEKFPDLFADFELHRKYELDLLPSYREIREFSEGKEEERKILRELGRLVYDQMAVAPPLNEADSISKAFLKLHRNRNLAAELEDKIKRLDAAKADWEKTVASITTAETKRDNATRALEAYYRELGRTAFTCLQSEIQKDELLQKIFEKAIQYQVVVRDRENEIARLKAAEGSVIDKSRHRMEILTLKTQNTNDSRRLQAAAEAVGEEFWKTKADQFEHDDLEPIKLRITGVINELERRRIELDKLYAHKRQIETSLEQEGLESSTHPDIDVPVFVEQLKTQARATNAMRPRMLENLGKVYWQHETEPFAETRGVIEQLNDLKKKIRAFEQED